MEELSPFFELPRELRDRIYFLICGGESLRIVGTYYGEKLFCWIRLPLPEGTFDTAEFEIRMTVIRSVLLVSRAFSKEAKEMIYATSQFNFLEDHNLRRFVNCIPNSSLRLLTKLQLDFSIVPIARSIWPNDQIRSCVMARMPSLMYLDIKITVLPESEDACYSQPDIVLLEKLYRSATFRKLRSATLTLLCYRVFDVEVVTMFETKARVEFEKMRHLIAEEYVEGTAERVI